MEKEKIRFTFLCLIILCFCFDIPNSPSAKADDSVYSLVTTKSKQNDNVYYTVGMGYADIWTNSAGQYIADPVTGRIVAPGATIVSHKEWSYKFSFSGRKIKNVKVSVYPKSNLINGETQEWTDKMFQAARYGDEYYTWEPQIATVLEIYDKGLEGKGSDTAIQKVSVKAILDAKKTPIITPGPPYADGVTYQRQYFPFLFRVELEPQQGQAFISHFTTDGKSLDGIDGFKNRVEQLTEGKDFTPTHTPGTTKYRYIGWKMSNVKSPSGGETNEGDPYPVIPYKGGGVNYWVNYYYEGDKPPPPPKSDCTEDVGRTIEVDLSDPAVSAVIRADQRGNERFNVLDGIPTSESLYGHVKAKEYLYKHKFVEHIGKCTYNVTVSQHYDQKWTEEETVTGPDGKPTTKPVPKTGSADVSKEYTVERPYSYWKIDNLEIYKIKEADLYNYAFESNGIRIEPTGYIPPNYEYSTNGTYTRPPPKNVTNPPKAAGKEVPDEDFTGDAEAAIPKVKVQNDSLRFNGQVIMSGQASEEKAQDPTRIPEPARIGEDVLYSPNHIIPISKINKKNAESSGTIKYDLMPQSIGGGSDRNYPIYGMNTVTVHTPVVMYPSVSDDQAHNQKTVPAFGRSAVILDRPFTVTLPTIGQHVSYLGYGYRDYAKYTRTKQVKFPFDVYTKDEAEYIPKGTWIDVPVSQNEASFFLPVWIDEGLYDVQFRSIAENAPNDFTEQTGANLDLVNHAARNTVPIEVIGRLYDFHITDIADYLWESVFRVKTGSSLPKGASYWVGLSGIDGGIRGNIAPFTLPIRPGSHPDASARNVAVKTGYHFKFDFKTKGNMFGPTDQIRIKPSFTFVSQNGMTRTPIDLYYHSPEQKFIRVGSPEDQVKRYVILNDRLRNVSQTELIDSALYRYNHDYTFGEIAGIGRNQFVSRFIRQGSRFRTPIGSLSLLTLPENVRTLIGPKSDLPATVDPQRANASIQKWYGEYSLPAGVYAVKKGTNLAEIGRQSGGITNRSEVFLKQGYIVVNFDIESLPRGDGANPRLQYIHGKLMNQWQLEGYKNTVMDPYGHLFQLQDGDVVFYHADLSSRDDFRSMVTH